MSDNGQINTFQDDTSGMMSAAAIQKPVTQVLFVFLNENKGLMYRTDAYDAFMEQELTHVRKLQAAKLNS